MRKRGNEEMEGKWSLINVSKKYFSSAKVSCFKISITLVAYFSMASTATLDIGGRRYLRLGGHR